MTEETKTKKKRKWPWITGGIILLIFILAIASGDPSKPSDQYFSIHSRLNELLQNKEGNPAFEVTPTDLSEADLKEWLSENTQKVDEYDQKQKEAVAKEFNVSVEEVENAFLRVTEYDLKRK